MYTQAYAMRNVTLYGFANGDILFAKDLVHTLTELSKQVPRHNGTLVVGKRWEFQENCTDKNYNVWTPEQVSSFNRSNKTVLDHGDAEDYFFVSRDFPWHKIHNVVIARRAYDNYLVERSEQLAVTTIDATPTVTAFHQCGQFKDRNNAMTRENLEFNVLVIGARFPYHKGITGNIHLMTQYDIFKNIFVVKRDTTSIRPDLEKKRTAHTDTHTPTGRQARSRTRRGPQGQTVSGLGV
jgi:hypothetical protein